MGTDIHAYIEFYDSTPQAYPPLAECFGGRLPFGRNYTLFNIIGDLRVQGPTSTVFPIRGIPASPELSHVCKNDLFCYVREDDEPSNLVLGRRSFSRHEAENLVTSGSTVYVNASKREVIFPGYHNITHLSLLELLQIRKFYLLEEIEFNDLIRNKKTRTDMLDFIKKTDPMFLMRYIFVDVEIKSLYTTLSTMITLEKFKNCTTRFVCWFDS